MKSWPSSVFNFSITGSGSPDNTRCVWDRRTLAEKRSRGTAQRRDRGRHLVRRRRTEKRWRDKEELLKIERKEIGSRRDVTCSEKNTRTRGSAMAHGSRIKIVPSSNNVGKRIVWQTGNSIRRLLSHEEEVQGGGEGTYLVIYTVQEGGRGRVRRDGSREKHERRWGRE